MRIRNSLLLGLTAGAAVFAMSACGSQGTAGAATAPSAAADSSAAATVVPSAAAVPLANACPADASDLQKAAGLDAGYKIDASSIKCKESWAIAAVIAPSAAQQGDGLLVFKNSPMTGRWIKAGEASDLTCGGELGIPASTGLCRPAA
jgi:hypothetical protein